MITPGKHPPLPFLLRTQSWPVFVFLALLWLLAWTVVPADWWTALGGLCRLCGYLAVLAMLVPYIHILRRSFRHLYLGNMNRWLWWHLAASYFAFLLVLLHSRAQAHSLLSQLLVVLLWVVMVSGVAGYFGQKVLYDLMPRLVRREYGMERIDYQRHLLLQSGQALCLDLLAPAWNALVGKLQEKNSALLALLRDPASSDADMEQLAEACKQARAEERKPPADRDWDTYERGKAMVLTCVQQFLTRQALDAAQIDLEGLQKAEPELARLFKGAEPLPGEQLKQRNYRLLQVRFPQEFPTVPPVVIAFAQRALSDCLLEPLRLWRGQPRVRLQGWLAHNTLEQALATAGEEQAKILERLWDLVEQRRELDLEYRLHQAGRLWLLFHGPAAWTLGVLILVHIVTSVWYGGY